MKETKMKTTTRETSNRLEIYNQMLKGPDIDPKQMFQANILKYICLRTGISIRKEYFSHESTSSTQETLLEDISDM